MRPWVVLSATAPTRCERATASPRASSPAGVDRRKGRGTENQRGTSQSGKDRSHGKGAEKDGGEVGRVHGHADRLPAGPCCRLRLSVPRLVQLLLVEAATAAQGPTAAGADRGGSRCGWRGWCRWGRGDGRSDGQSGRRGWCSCRGGGGGGGPRGWGGGRGGGEWGGGRP